MQLQCQYVIVIWFIPVQFDAELLFYNSTGVGLVRVLKQNDLLANTSGSGWRCLPPLSCTYHFSCGI
jgi:hypothetical protein